MLSRGQEIEVEVDDARGVDIVLRAGEMSLHHVRMVHGSPANRLDDRRIGFAIRYIPTYVRQLAGAVDGAMLVRGVDEHQYYVPERAPAADLSPARARPPRGVGGALGQDPLPRHRRRALPLGDSRMRTIDIHAHLVPQSLWRAIEAGREWFGYRHQPGEGLGTLTGGGRRTAFSSPKVRFTVEERLKDMDAQGVDMQVVSIHTPFFGTISTARRAWPWPAR